MVRLENLVKRVACLLLKKVAGFIPDRRYLEWMYRIRMGRSLDLDHPLYYTEKLQWLKLYYHRPEFTMMVDKYAAKSWVAGLIGSEYVVPTLGVWENADDIDFDALPDQFVLKCTHDSGSVVICRDKSAFDVDAAKDKLNRFLRRDFYAQTREWVYCGVPRRIIAEPFLVEEDGDLKDYKFLCFNGVPKIMYAVAHHLTKKTFNYYDMDFSPMPIASRNFAHSDLEVSKPEPFEKMKILAATLSAGIPHVRVDFYCIGSRIYWGEQTFFYASGFDDLSSLEWDRKLGDWLPLPSPYLENDDVES